MGFSAHTPVMLKEVLEILSPAQGKTYIDATFGAGGYSEAILKHSDCRVIAFDRDESVGAFANVLKDKFGNRFDFHHLPFSKMDSLPIQADGVVFDLGVSSMQLDQGERGFSFSKNAPLDMRMDKSQSRTAYNFVNDLDEKDMADFIYMYGEERHSRRIAKAITNARKIKAVTDTAELAEIITLVLPRKKQAIHPATRTFQAIRIWVNDELGELEQGLNAAFNMLQNQGRMVVVSFHSLEDRMVKNFISSQLESIATPNRHTPFEALEQKKECYLHTLTRGALMPGEDECMTNPRARSARLRAATKILAQKVQSQVEVRL